MKSMDKGRFLHEEKIKDHTNLGVYGIFNTTKVEWKYYVISYKTNSSNNIFLTSQELTDPSSSLFKRKEGNITISGKFDESGIISTDISTLRARGKSLNEFEQSLFDLVEEVSQKLLGNLDYESGNFRISFEVAGIAMPYNSPRNISVNIHFILENNFL